MLYSSPNNMASVSKVIIIGGGIGGLTLARACLDVGIAVELYEKRGLDAMLSYQFPKLVLQIEPLK